MKPDNQSYARQVMVLLAIIISIWAIGIVLTAAFAEHSLFDYDVGIDLFRGTIDNDIITLVGTVTNYGNEHLEFTYTVYVNDDFIAENNYLLGVGQYIKIEYKYDARHLGYAVQNFDAGVYAELDQNPENDYERTYVTTGTQA